MSYIYKVNIPENNQDVNYLIEPLLYIEPTKNGVTYSANLSDFQLVLGAAIQVKFINASVGKDTLSINSQAKSIYYKGSAITAGAIQADSTYTLVYNGTVWEIVGDLDTDTIYTLPPAEANVLGGIKVGYTTNDKNYKVQLDSNNNAYVNVPWTDTTYEVFNKSGTNHSTGLVPDPGATEGNTKFLREDGTWSVPSYLTIGTTASTAMAGNTAVDKVKQEAVGDTYSNWRPLVISAANNATEGFSPSTVTGTTYITSTITAQPSTGTIRATTFKGNASSATQVYVSGIAIPSTSRVTYLLQNNNTTDGNYDLITHNRLYLYENTTATYLGVGRSSETSSRQGGITIHAGNKHYGDLIVSSNLSENRTYTLPNKTGTIALISDIPTNLNQLTNGPGYVTSSGVTSVSTGTGLTGGDITDTGTISLADNYGDSKNPYGSKTKNYVLAAPSDTNGQPSFRKLVAADIPDLSESYSVTTHSHDLSIAKDTSSTTTNVTLTAGTKYKLTAGGKTYLFTTQADTNKYHKSGSWGGTNNLTYTATAVNSADELAFTLPAASTDKYGVTKLYNGVDSASTDLAATASAVKTAYDKANSITASSLGLSSALRFVGITTTDMTNGSSTNNSYTGVPEGITNYTTPAVGDVVINNTKKDEWVCTSASETTYTWERLGSDTSYKIIQDSVSSPTASTTTSTTFIDTISQNANGVITATKKTLPTASSSVAGITKIGASGGAAAYSHRHSVANLDWAGGVNLKPTATANNQEWSVDLTPGDYTGTYWHVWSAKNSKSILCCYTDDNKVTVPNGDLSIGKTLYVGTGADITGTTILQSTIIPQLKIYNSSASTGTDIAIQLLRGDSSVSASYVSWQISLEDKDLYIKDNYKADGTGIQASYTNSLFSLARNSGNATFKGSVTAKSFTVATNNDAIAHLLFGRSTYNYIAFPSGGELCLNGNTSTMGTARSIRIGITTDVNGITSGYIYPGVTNKVALGSSDLKWSNIYATTFTGDLSGNAATATSANHLKSDSTLTYTSGLQYYSGQPTIGSADGNGASGSNANFKLWSYPADYTGANDSIVNIQSLRLYWNASYLHEIFSSPNNEQLLHRSIMNNVAKNWRVILDSGNTSAEKSDGSDVSVSWNTSTKIATINGVDVKIKIPSNPNSNTTYTFANGTGGFTVTPSGGTAQTVSIGKPSTAGTADKAKAANLTTTTGDIAYYSNTTGAFADGTQVQYLHTKVTVGTSTTDKYIDGLYIKGTAFNAAEDITADTAGVLSYGDAGPQIRFTDSDQSGTILFHRWNNGDSSVSFNFLSNQGGDGALVRAGCLLAIKRAGIGYNTLDNNYVLKVSGKTYIGGELSLANNTWNVIGDDAYLGDINKAGHIGIQGKNGNTGIFFTTYNQTTKTTGGAITWNGTKFSITSTTAIDASISGNAGTATEFSSNATVALTGDVTGTSSGSKKSWSVATTLADSGVTADTYGVATTGTQSISHSGTFTVPYFTVDSKGRITTAGTKTYQLPSSGNSDHYPSAWCETAAGTQAKAATCTEYVLTNNTWLHVLIKNANSYNGKITLNVNSKGAKDIWINGAVSSSSNKTLPAGTYLVYYDGTQYHFRTDGTIPGNTLTASTASQLQSIDPFNVYTGSSTKQHITLQTLMDWLINTKKYIPSGVQCYRYLVTKWEYANNDYLQFTCNGINYELQLAGCVIEFWGSATAYNTGVFRLGIHSSPTLSFTAAEGYTKFPTSSYAEYTCNGSGFSPAWRVTTATTTNSAPTLSWGTTSDIGTVNGVTFQVKAMAKPSYTYSDVGAAPSSTVSCTTANVKSALSTGSDTTKFLNNKGEWAVPPGTYSYTLPLAASGTRGGIQIGYTESGTNYAVKLNSEKAYVTVPWTDTHMNVTLQNTTTSSTYIYFMGFNTAPTSTATAKTGVSSTSMWANAVDKGKFELVLGNSTSTANAGGQFGQIALYSAKSAGTYLKSADGTSWTTATLQAKTGTIALTSDIPTNLNQLTNGPGYVTSSGVTKVSTGAGLTGGDITATGTVKANLTSETKLTNAAADGTETSGRVYPVRLDKNGKLAVNVPWTNVNSSYLTSHNNKVKQTAKDSGSFKLLASAEASPTSGTAYEAVYDTNIYMNAEDNQLVAGGFVIHNKATTPVEKVTLEYNSTDQSLDFIFA